jgi:hypothetical protein
MASQDIRLGVGGFVCEKAQKIIFFANAFSSMPQIASIFPDVSVSSLPSSVKRFALFIQVITKAHGFPGPLSQWQGNCGFT